MKPNKKFFLETNVAGRQYYDCDEVFDELIVGTKLRLERDEFNRHDENAVQLVYDKKVGDDEVKPFLLGYLPRSCNDSVANLLDMGWGCVFDCTISRINPDVHYEQQLRITLRIKRNEQ